MKKPSRKSKQTPPSIGRSGARRIYAVMADIHANWEALKEVANDASTIAKQEKRGEPIFVSLGDAVDYGPEPNECLAWLKTHVDLAITGNHDVDVIASCVGGQHPQPRYVQKDYWPMTLWTRHVLDAPSRHLLQEWQNGVAHRPNGLQDFTLFHGSLDCIDGRLDCREVAHAAFRRLKKGNGMFGHTHYQGWFEYRPEEDKTIQHLVTRDMIDMVVEQSGWWSRRPLSFAPRLVEYGHADQWNRLPNSSTRCLVNPGSVGQPRPHSALLLHEPRDHRACYLLLRVGEDGVWYRFRRVDYDWRKTVALLEQIEWQPNGHCTNGADVLPNDPPAGSAPKARPGYLAADDVVQISAELPKLVRDTLIPMIRPVVDPSEGPDR